MRRAAALMSVLALALLVAPAAAPAQDEPVDPVLPPVSRWGPADEAGNSNTQTPDKVLQAVKLIRTGKKYLLGHEYTPDMPLFPGNTWRMAAKGPVQVGRQVVNAEHFAGDVAQSGTQFDALGHFGVLPSALQSPLETLFYNRFSGSEVFGPLGLKRLGIERMKPFFTRGVLIDVKRYVNDGTTLAPGEEITVSMAKRALAAQRMSGNDIREGDVVLFVTGWEEFWDDGSLTYYAGAPGLPGAVPGVGVELAKWLAAKRVAAVGADNWGVEVFPAPAAPAGVAAPVHNELLVRNGIPHQESMHLSELADDLAGESRGRRARRHMFAYVFVPLPIEGASGSPGIPMAIR